LSALARRREEDATQLVSDGSAGLSLH